MVSTLPSKINRDLYDKVQRIRHSGVRGHHHNGVSYNAIKDVVIIARTIMIHYALRWPDASDKIL